MAIICWSVADSKPHGAMWMRSRLHCFSCHGDRESGKVGGGWTICFSQVGSSLSHKPFPSITDAPLLAQAQALASNEDSFSDVHTKSVSQRRCDRSQIVTPYWCMRSILAGLACWVLLSSHLARSHFLDLIPALPCSSTLQLVEKSF